MKNLITLYNKEIKPYFLSPFGWVIIAVVLIFQGLSLSSVLESYEKMPVQKNLVLDTVSTPMFGMYFLVIFPLITMRLFSEEERSGTLETLMTAPVRTWQVLLAKYLSALSFYAVLWFPLYLHVRIFVWLSDTPLPTNGSQIIGLITILLLIGSLFIAFGCLGSALSSSQIIAAIITFGIIVFHVFLGFIPRIMGESFASAEGAKFFNYLSLENHLNSFGQGLMDSRCFIYYLSMAALVLFITHHTFNYRRWSK